MKLLKAPKRFLNLSDLKSPLSVHQAKYFPERLDKLDIDNVVINSITKYIDYMLAKSYDAITFYIGDGSFEYTIKTYPLTPTTRFALSIKYCTDYKTYTGCTTLDKAGIDLIIERELSSNVSIKNMHVINSYNIYTRGILDMFILSLIDCINESPKDLDKFGNPLLLADIINIENYMKIKYREFIEFESYPTLMPDGNLSVKVRFYDDIITKELIEITYIYEKEEEYEPMPITTKRLSVNMLINNGDILTNNLNKYVAHSIIKCIIDNYHLSI